MSLDPNKTYLVWNGTEFPNSTSAQFKAPAGSTIDWGDGTVETFDTASTTVNTHTYTDGKTEHTIAISGLTSISASAFLNCSSLTSVTIGNSVTSIGSYAFGDCNSLTGVYITDIVTWCNISFQNYEANPLYYAHNLYLNNELVTELTIPDSVTTIKSFAFAYCSSLASVTIGGVTTIGNWSFEGCDSLTSVTIDNGVESIYNKVFYNCSSLIQLILFPSAPPTLASDAIPTTVQSIYVQQSSKAVYKTATNWTTFASKIVSDNIYLSFVRFNQKNKAYISKKVDEKVNNKLTAPTTPTADSVVTMATNGTTGTKALSEFGGKLYNHRLYYMNASIGNAYIDIINSSDTAFTQPSEFISFIDNKVATVIGSNAIGTAVVRFFKDDIIWLKGCGINPSDTTVSATIDMQLSTTHFVSDTVTEL